MKLAYSLQSIASDHKTIRPSSIWPRGRKLFLSGLGHQQRGSGRHPALWEQHSQAIRHPVEQEFRPATRYQHHAEELFLCRAHSANRQQRKNLPEREHEEQQSTVSSVRLTSRGARARQLPRAEPCPPCMAGRLRTPSLTHKGGKLLFNEGFRKQHIAQALGDGKDGTSLLCSKMAPEAISLPQCALRWDYLKQT